MNLEQQLIQVTELYLAKLKECEDLKRRNAKLRSQIDPIKVNVTPDPDVFRTPDSVVAQVQRNLDKLVRKFNE